MDQEQYNNPQWTYTDAPLPQFTPTGEIPQQEAAEPQKIQKPPKKAKGGAGKIIALALCFSLLGSAFIVHYGGCLQF